MAEAPRLYRYCAGDRGEVFAFLRETLAPDASERLIAQWAWKYEENPFTPSAGPSISLLRIGTRLASILCGFSLPMWMGGIECTGECRGTWATHPAWRGRGLWSRVDDLMLEGAPVLIGWAHVPAKVSRIVKFGNTPVRPLVRVLDAAAMIAHFTRSRAPQWVGWAANLLARATLPLPRRNNSAPGSVVRMQTFDDRFDALWARARRRGLAMVARDHRYLNWRFRERPDESYIMYAFQRDGEIDAYLVARTGIYQGMRWGYLVDFLAPEASSDALAALIARALADFQAAGAVAASCHVTWTANRSQLLRCGFLPAPQRNPVRFTHRIRPERGDLARFADLRAWYLTMGDGDLEMTP